MDRPSIGGGQGESHQCRATTLSLTAHAHRAAPILPIRPVASHAKGDEDEDGKINYQAPKGTASGPCRIQVSTLAQKHVRPNAQLKPGGKLQQRPRPILVLAVEDEVILTSVADVALFRQGTRGGAGRRVDYAIDTSSAVFVNWKQSEKCYTLVQASSPEEKVLRQVREIGGRLLDGERCMHARLQRGDAVRTNKN